MSTRSQLRFVQRVEQPSETDDDAERVAQVYWHSDGYLGTVLRELAQLKELLNTTRVERGPAYTAATFVFPDKLSTTDLYLDGEPERTIDAAQPAGLLDPASMEHLDQPLFLLGHSVENPANGVHGNEEYLYIVELLTQNPFEEPAEWTVKVSGHSAFPR